MNAEVCIENYFRKIGEKSLQNKINSFLLDFLDCLWKVMIKTGLTTILTCCLFLFLDIFGKVEFHAFFTKMSSVFQLKR